MASFATLVLFILMVFKIYIGLLPIGQLNTLFGSVVQMSWACSIVVATWQRFLRFQNQMDYVSNILKPDGDRIPSEEKVLPVVEENVITFSHVSFSYSDGDEVLHDISFNLDLEGVMVLIGTNGSGKTTLVKLLLGLYRPTTGKILFNGDDISEFSLGSYFSLFKVVFQDYEIFDFSVAQNVSASVHQNNKRLRHIINSSGIAKWVNNLPQREETEVGSYSENNFQPSGGQEQQIAIARAQYKHGIYQVLDEPSSAMDPIKELDLVSRIKKFSKDMPSLFITHRIGATALASKIILLKNGKIEDVGTQKELFQRSPYFRELWKSQAKLYAPDTSFDAYEASVEEEEISQN